MNPFFSVIIPAYNRAIVLPNAIQSVLNQSFQNFEIIIVDDGSTDYTRESVASFQDSRIYYHYQKNQGVCAARNQGISISKGMYLCFLDSDDDVDQNWLQNFYEPINNTAFDLVFCDMTICYPDNKTKNVKALYPHREDKYDDNGLFLAGTFTIKKEFIQKTGGFDEKIKYGEFTEFGLRCRKYSPNNYFTNQIGFLYKVSVSGGGKNNKNIIESNIYLLQKHYDFFRPRPRLRYLYLQNIAIAYARLGQYNNSRIYFLKSLFIRPWLVKTYLRLLLTLFPFLAKKKWSSHIK